MRLKFLPKLSVSEMLVECELSVDSVSEPSESDSLQIEHDSVISKKLKTSPFSFCAAFFC